VSATLTSKLNNTPPIGDPNATEIPAAAAAERTSLFLATLEVRNMLDKMSEHSTFVTSDIVEKFHKKIRTTTSHMNKGSFLAKPHTRCHSKTLRSSVPPLLLGATTYQSK
jgi:hypothetical protein